MKLRERAPVRWLAHAVGRRGADSQVTLPERACLMRHAAGRRRLVEIGVMHGVTTALLRSVMDPRGTITGVDPHPAGRLGVSFERLIALREIGRPRHGRAVLLRTLSHEAAARWREPIDFLFIDGDHSWQGIERDWLGWSRFLVPGGIVALHDSRSVPTRPDLDSVRYTEQVVLRDERFRLVETVESLTILARRGEAGRA
ncbi:MAG TPA: class I SAM-dependent methyltransferase [Methylomirabilota bacterium]|nr:class I SAM-dependent methyltransferase [Methylomirabilota bacterium]